MNFVLGKKLLAGAILFSVTGACLANDMEMKLERVVILMRHGVRPPTKSAKAMASLSEFAWPDAATWGAEAGELTPHGAQAIRKFGVDLRQIYTNAGLLPNKGSIDSRVLIWADGADQRTRASAHFLAEGMVPAAPPATGARAEGDSDPLFDALDGGICKLNPDHAEKAVLARGPIDTPELNAALQRLQEIMAPQACTNGAGVCLTGSSKLAASTSEVKLSGPLATAATVSEAFLLEYENGLPTAQFAWGRASKADLDQLLRIHERTSDLTRRTPYIATRRAAPLVHFILTALAEKTVTASIPAVREEQKVIVLVGHDTNLSNLAGVFDLDWHLPDQPDVTAPGTALAFERWRNSVTGKAELRIRLFYRDLEQVRTLSDTATHQIALRSAACEAAHAACELGGITQKIEGLLPAECVK